ncbi:hypothetical protein F511_36449 [Dorcoceras hygrometricum]|uniref:Uncharacterized protein n=1 Tax=Dorcoceras hygrometricum TaxID=472368 RepID=A0A2Z7D5C2_9LAMI|nr:hypothetical protein F511_36449 [Dorcoceras hygrometricum]
MLTIVLDKDLECAIVYVRCDSEYDGYHETHLIVTVHSEYVPSRLGRRNEDKAPELETSICDVKYLVSLSTGCVLGKWVSLVTLAMSLFDLQDVCIAIGSLATLDLSMVVDLIGIYVLKGPYSFRGDSVRGQNPSDLLVQTDGGIVFPIVDLIRRSTAAYNSRARIPCESGWSQAPRRQQGNDSNILSNKLVQQRTTRSQRTSNLVHQLGARNERLKGEAENTWTLGKEEFLKSSKFDDLCADKASAFFECGFKGCLAQFRANGYTKEEYLASFLSVVKALEDMSDDEEEADEDASGDEDSPKDSPRPQMYLDFLMLC